ncbi:transcriptional regulator [Salinisphaera sp. PC39]|uniref:helix-turn-helix transcriptional regulator n=1 Tax=Salinisphaera sp. PC39 TaxID=1304156 RepID=UPI003342DC81
MDRLDRIYALHGILKARRYPVSRQQLADELDCSESTVYRVRDALISHFGAPVESEEGTGRLYYPRPEADNFELPGLWFNASELYALLAAQKLLVDVQPGVIDAEIAPLRDRINRILSHRRLGNGELARRIRILSIADRPIEADTFRTLAAALIERRRLTLHYRPRSSDRSGEREVSPQRLTRYRDNWYLDAWCHQREDLRSFAVDRIDNPRTSAEAAKHIDEPELDRRLATAYGIFSGEPTNIAVLIFQHERAEWIADETWHPEQQSRWRDDGRYELRIPYGDPTELILDILRYGDDVEVAEPETLRRQIAQKLEKAAMRYRTSGNNQ